MAGSPAQTSLRQLAGKYDFDIPATVDWLNHYRSKVPDFLLKISGACLTPDMAEDIALLSKVIPLAVVVGGGDEITVRCNQLDIPVEKYGPWRVTTKKVLEVVVDVMTRMANYFSGLINKYGGKAFPLVGTPTRPLIFANKLERFPVNIEGKEIEAGYFGVIPEAQVKKYLGSSLLERIVNAEPDEVPVVAALGHQYEPAMPDGGYQALNIDGDDAVKLIANHVPAQEVFIVTPSGGVKEQRQGTAPDIVPLLPYSEFMARRSGLLIDEGMDWKLKAAFRILNYGRAGVALLSPADFVPYLLDRDERMSFDNVPGLRGLPPHRNGFYGTTLVSSET